jgi:4Fe-4S ferredoxin
LACPKEAIKLEKQPKTLGQKAEKAKIDIELSKCNFCGICDILCPYGAIKVAINGNHVLSVVDKESFPQLIRDIQVNTSKCPEDCVECEKACPLDLIKVSSVTPDGNSPIESKVKVDIQKDYCPCCRVCEFKCPKGVTTVRKFLYGKILIHPEKCPEGCTDCLDVCPITGALYLSDQDKKVYPNETFCVYCGACKAVCPVDEALELKRTRISHTPLRSGAWNKTLERLASPIEVTKELKATGARRAKDSVEKRLGWRTA